MEYEIEIVARQPEDTAVIKGVVPHGAVGEFIPDALGELFGTLGMDPIVGPPFCRMDMTDTDFVLEVGFPVERPVQQNGRVEPSHLPGGTVATVMNVGPYDSVGPAYAALQAWLDEHHYESTGAPWEAYLDGPEVAQPRTLISWPCQRADSEAQTG